MNYFSDDELKCKCGCNGLKINHDFLDKLNTLRERCGFALPVSSGYRCSDHNDRVSGTGRDGPHTTGHAVDIQVSGEKAYRVVENATNCGFLGIGVKQHGDHGSRFIHLDDLTTVPRPWVWSYK